MIDLASETSIDRLRQVAILLQYENNHLHERLQALMTELAKARGADAASLQQEIALLQQQIDRQRQALFGTSSERRKKGSKGTAANAAADSDDTKPQQGHGPTEQTKLPIVECIYELDEADKVCTSCGGELLAMDGQFEESEEVDVVERSFRIVRTKRQKYRCRCGNCIETALGPPKLIAGGRYSVGFAIEVATAKYLDHAPLARQVRQMGRKDLTVTTQTLWDQIAALAGYLVPTYRALHAYVLTSPVIGADETTWRLMEKGGSKKWWAWSVCRSDAVYYEIGPTRSKEAAISILQDYAGTVICDGYGVYGSLYKERRELRDGTPAFEMANCWSHARRYYCKAEPHYPQTITVLDLIDDLFAIEAEATAVSDTLPQLYRHRAELRRERSRPVIDSIRQWMIAQRVLPGSSLSNAILYSDKLWKGLTRFLDDPMVAIHNNATEGAIRGIALGRRNHFGSRSLRGTQVAALFYSVFESAKLAGIDPVAYIRTATERAMAAPGTVTLPSQLIPP